MIRRRTPPDRRAEKKSPRQRLAALLCAVLLLCGCGQAGGAEPVKRELFAMDTVMELTAYGEGAGEALDAATAEIARLDKLLSTGNPDSEISRLNAAGSGAPGEEALAMLQEAQRIYERTDGAFDVTVYPLMQLWGFGTDAPAVPDPAALAACLERVGMDKLTFSDGMLTLGKGQGIDLGGIAKGYTSGRLMQIFAAHGVESGLVSLGGNVQCLGTRPDGEPWRCGIRDPEGTGYLGIVRVTDAAVITSGGYERYFEEGGQTYHHILDPKTGYPAQSGLVSVTVVSANGMLADALSTACFVMGAEKAIACWQTCGAEEGAAFELVLLTEDGRVTVTEGLKDAFTTDYPLDVIERASGG